MNIGYITTFSATEPATEYVIDEHSTGDAADTNSEATSAHTTEEAGHGEESEGIGALGLDPYAIGAQALTFLVLFWVIKKFALDGIVANLSKRETDINRGLHLTAELDKQKEELELTVEKALKAARKEADVIIAEASAETGKMIQTAEEKANHRADEILRAAEGKIERDIADARQSLKGEMAGLVTEATEAILGEKLDTTSDRKLVENYLKEAMK